MVWADEHLIGELTNLDDSSGELYRRFGVVNQASYAFVRGDGK